MQHIIEWERVGEGLTPVGDDAYRAKSEALHALAYRAFRELRVFFRGSHLASWRAIHDAADSSDNEKQNMYRNIAAAVESATKGVPYCQDTGTDVAYVFRGANVLTPDNIRENLQAGATKARHENPFRNSIFVPRASFTEVNSGDNTPMELNLFDAPAESKNEISGLFVCKGGGSGSKLWSFSEKPLLASRRDKLIDFLVEKIAALGHAACPPYHLCIALGGLSHLHNSQLLTRLTVDDPTIWKDAKTQRDTDLEQEILRRLKASRMGAQGEGKYFVHPYGIRVIRAPRHAAHFFVGLGVSCSAHRIQAWKITPAGTFIEKLEQNPQRYLPTKQTKKSAKKHIHIHLEDKASALTQLRQLKSGDTFLISGPVLGARDKAHALWLTQFEQTGLIPEYLKQHAAVFYVGPSDTPKGDIIGSFGPTTASRMDGFAPFLLSNNLIPLSIAKGNRSAAFAAECKTHAGLYGTIQGGPASLLRKYIKEVSVIDFDDLGMEAVRRYIVEDMPVKLIVDRDGNDLYAGLADSFLSAK